MSALYTFDAKLRTDTGKGASRRLRHANLVPAIIYGGDKEPQSVTLEHRHILKAQENEGFYSHILTLDVEGDKVECIVKDMQRHPYKPVVMHLDFQRIDASHKLTTNVPLHFVNESTNAAVKRGGVVNHLVNSIDITCLPAHLPEFIEVNLADLEEGHSVHLSDLKLPKGVSSVDLSKGEDHDLAVANIQMPRGAAADSAEAEDAAE